MSRVPHGSSVAPYLPEGAARPEAAELESFWASARSALPVARLGAGYQVRWIGLDDASTEQVLDLIVAGDKTGTFTLPWIVERTGQPHPRVGDCIILIDFHGRPRLLVRLTRIEQALFGAITARQLAVDGPPVRSLEVWKPLHTMYWNGLLEPLGLEVSEDMPVLIETFELLFGGAARRG